MQAAADPSQRTAILLAVGGALALGAMDGFSKVALVGLPLPVVIGMRYVFAFLLIAVICGRPMFADALGAPRKGAMVLRGMMPIAASFSFAAALTEMRVADVTVILFAAPFIATALAVPLLKERVGIHRWGAVIVGFCGVLLVIRPNADMQAIALLPLLTATIFALYQLITRMMRFGSGPTVLLFFMVTTGLVVTVPLMIAFWQTPTMTQMTAMALAGGFYGIAHLCLTRAFVLAEASSLTPFMYSQIVAAAALGYILFGEVPDALAWAGTAVIVAGGLYVWRREIIRKGGRVR